MSFSSSGPNLPEKLSKFSCFGNVLVVTYCSAVNLPVDEKVPAQNEQVVWLALVPVLATGMFYVLPASVQQSRVIQFLPQVSAYVALGIWWTRNVGAPARLCLEPVGMSAGLTWGCITGLLLGMFNTWIILSVVPTFGGDILFLTETPHAQVPTWVMVPWGIALIAVGVELNFRGFLLGRLEQLLAQWGSKSSPAYQSMIPWLAVVCSALVFAFDPFMVATFRHLHWIAVWDGLVWGWILLLKRNLYAVIVAHAVEVVILYLSIKTALT